MSTDDEEKFLFEKYKKLKKEHAELEESLEESDKKDGSARKQEVMMLLHKYNETKDAAQIVLGALANIEGVTVKEMHNKMGLPLDS